MGFFTEDELAVLAATHVRVAVLTKFCFKSEIVRVWNGNTDLETAGFTWKPMYGLGTIDGLNVSGDGQSEKITFGLPGLPEGNDILEKAIAETNETDGRLATVYLQFFDADWATVGNPHAIAWGFMQKPVVDHVPIEGESGAVQSISLAAENAFFNRSRPPAGRYTDRDQQARHPGDRITQFIPALINHSFVYPDY